MGRLLLCIFFYCFFRSFLNLGIGGVRRIGGIAAVRFHRQGHDGAVGGAGLCGCALGYYPAGAVALELDVEVGGFQHLGCKTAALARHVRHGGHGVLVAEAWRTVAIVYAIIGLIVNTLSVFSVKELPEEEFVDTTDKAEIEKDEKYGLVEAAKLLVCNKYYLMICVTYILQQIYGAMISIGTFYTAHILGDKNLFGVFS